MARIPIALQLWSVNKECAKDFEGTLKAVADMGYDGVEFAGYYERGARDIRRMLDDLKLKVAGSHLGLKALIGDELDRTVEFERTLGNRNLIVPGLPKEMTASRAAWRQAAATFNEVAAGLRPHAMRTGYHNHLVEFKSLEGEEPWDTFFSNASPDVIMQVDVGNALAGGGDPIPCISRYPGRARTVHLKEHSRTNDRAIISEGDVRWDELFRLCESVGGTEWYIVEQESYAYPPLTCVAKCLEALKKMGK